MVHCNKLLQKCIKWLDEGKQKNQLHNFPRQINCTMVNGMGNKAIGECDMEKTVAKTNKNQCPCPRGNSKFIIHCDFVSIFQHC